MRQKRTTSFSIIHIIALLPILSGCGSVAGALGASPLTTQILNAVGWTTTAIDVPRVINDQKTINEEILSEIIDKDCKFKRVLKDKAICIENVKKKYKEDSSNPIEDRSSEIQWVTPPHK